MCIRDRLYGAVPEFVVAVDESDRVIGYGAIHAMWEHLGEVRTLGVSEQWLGPVSYTHLDVYKRQE